MFQKILVIGGLHGNEPLGIEIVKELCVNPIEGVTAIFGNPEAIKLNSRFKDKDLNRVFPGNDESKIYEEQRALEIIKEAKGYNLVLDFHNTYCPDNDCSFVGGNNYKQSLKASEFLGLNRVILADYDCVNKYVPNCLSVEISLSSSLNSKDYWISKIKDLRFAKDIRGNLNMIELYKFIGRISKENSGAYQDLQAFKALSRKQQLDLGGEKEIFPIFINDAYTPHNFCGLIQRVD